MSISAKDRAQDNIALLNRKYDLIADAKSALMDTNSSVIILNICNNMNTFGAGFNKTIAQEFPIAKENYHLLGATKIKNALGHTQFVTTKINPKHKNEIIIANMICQTGIMSTTNTRPINYCFLGICLAKTQSYIKQYLSQKDLPIKVFSPKFQGNVTGANWSFVYDLILDTLRKPTFTHVYESYN